MISTRSINYSFSKSLFLTIFTSLLCIGVCVAETHMLNVSAISIHDSNCVEDHLDVKKIRAALNEVIKEYEADANDASRNKVAIKFKEKVSTQIKDQPDHKKLVLRIAEEVCVEADVPFLVSSNNEEVEVKEVSRKEFDAFKVARNAEIEATIFKVVEEPPRFAGCDGMDKIEGAKCSTDKMIKFIYTHIEYPAEARKKGVEGTVVIRFVVEANGELVDIEPVREIGAGTTEAALKVVHAMPNWIPAKQRGKKVAVQFNLPIKFKLDKASLKEAKKNAKRTKGN